MKRDVQTFFFLLFGLHLINSAFRKEVLFPLDGSGVKSLGPTEYIQRPPSVAWKWSLNSVHTCGLSQKAKARSVAFT